MKFDGLPNALPNQIQRTQQVETNAKHSTDDQRLRQAAEDFESIFMQQMLKTMRESGVKSDLVPESRGEKIFRSMLDEQYAQLMVKSGRSGLAEQLYQQLRQKDAKP
jgi:flagellar protein FlgJ